MLGQALRGWERSLDDAESVKVTAGGKDGDKTERTVRGQSGNPAHLTAAVNILAAIRKLLRLDAIDADPAESEAAARTQVAGVILGALAGLPEDARAVVGDRLSRALLEGTPRGRGRD